MNLPVNSHQTLPSRGNMADEISMGFTLSASPAGPTGRKPGPSSARLRWKGGDGFGEILHLLPEPAAADIHFRKTNRFRSLPGASRTIDSILSRFSAFRPTAERHDRWRRLQVFHSQTAAAGTVVLPFHGPTDQAFSPLLTPQGVDMGISSQNILVAHSVF